MPLIGIIEYYFGSARQIPGLFFEKCIFFIIPRCRWDGRVDYILKYGEVTRLISNSRVVHLLVRTEAVAILLFRSFEFNFVHNGVNECR